MFMSSFPHQQNTTFPQSYTLALANSNLLEGHTIRLESPDGRGLMKY